MPPFDYNAPAELFLAKRTKSSRENYWRFATAAEAIRYAVEILRTPRAFGAWLQVGDERFNSVEIQRGWNCGLLSAVADAAVPPEPLPPCQWGETLSRSRRSPTLSWTGLPMSVDVVAPFASA
jgi:hypothetical protein